MKRLIAKTAQWFQFSAILFIFVLTAQAQVTTHAGTLPDGATSLIEVPANSNIFFAGGRIVPTAPAFVDFHPAPYLRPFDALDECGLGFGDHDCHDRSDFFRDR